MTSIRLASSSAFCFSERVVPCSIPAVSSHLKSTPRGAMKCANQPSDSAHERLAIGRLPCVGTCDGVGPFLPALACSHFLGLGTNCSLHSGHSIRSKSMRRNSGQAKSPFHISGIPHRATPHFFEIDLLRAWHDPTILIRDRNGAELQCGSPVCTKSLGLNPPPSAEAQLILRALLIGAGMKEATPESGRIFQP